MAKSMPLVTTLQDRFFKRFSLMSTIPWESQKKSPSSITTTRIDTQPQSLPETSTLPSQLTPSLRCLGRNSTAGEVNTWSILFLSLQKYRVAFTNIRLEHIPEVEPTTPKAFQSSTSKPMRATHRACLSSMTILLWYKRRSVLPKRETKEILSHEAEKRSVLHLV